MGKKRQKRVDEHKSGLVDQDRLISSFAIQEEDSEDGAEDGGLLDDCAE